MIIALAHAGSTGRLFLCGVEGGHLALWEVQRPGGGSGPWSASRVELSGEGRGPPVPPPARRGHALCMAGEPRARVRSAPLGSIGVR